MAGRREPTPQVGHRQWRPGPRPCRAQGEAGGTPTARDATRAVRLPGAVNLKALNTGEILATIGGLLLAVSVFFPWYTLANANAELHSCHGPNATCTGWESLAFFRYLILLAAIAPAILAWIIVRGHA